jgi:segregation and condensation protein B
LISEVGRQETPGHPRVFGTTLRFLQIVGLERVEDLPELPENLRMPELDEAEWTQAEPVGASGYDGEDAS